MIAFALTFIMLALPLFSVFADGSNVPPPISEINDSKLYALKNKQTGLYLTLPCYTEVNDQNNPETSIYQYPQRTNDQYSRAVTLTYSPQNGLYTIEAALFKNFENGRITYDSSDNLYLSQTTSNGLGEWILVYNAEYGGYRILNQYNEAITASRSAYGNLYVTYEQLGYYQIWELEEITANPHLIKPDVGIEKKNIGTGCEWIFTLRNAEANVRSIQSVEAVINPDLVTVSTHANGFVAKINPIGDSIEEAYDKYALIKITLDNDEIRYIMVQDAGTGNYDACRTIPIYKYSRYATVTIPENGTKDFLITLTSEIGGKPVVRWEINDDLYVCQAIYDGNVLAGTNYIVVTAQNIGFASVSAYVDINNDSTPDKEYSVLIEIRTQNTVHPNVMTLDSTIEQLELQYGTVYLMKTPILVHTNVLTDEFTLNDLWRLDYSDTASILVAGANYAVIQTATKDDFEVYNTVTPERYFYNGVTVPLEYGLIDIDFAFKKNRKLYLDNGTYYIQNLEYSDKFLQTNSDENDDFMEIWDFDGEEDQQWIFTYLNNGFYKIQSAEWNNYALTIAEDVLTDENARIRQGVFDSSLHRFQWQITHNAGGGYTIQNRATLENDSTKSYSMANGPALVEGENGNNVLNRVPQSDKSDEWLIVFDSLPVSYCNYTIDENNDVNAYRIGYFVHSPKVYVDYITDALPNQAFNQDEYSNAIDYALTTWNNALGINITRTNSKDEADIYIRITSLSEFESYTGADFEYASSKGCAYFPEDFDFIYDKKCGDNVIKVFEIEHMKIGIFVYEDEAVLKHVLLHELGHALGHWEHSANITDIMYPKTNVINNHIIDLSAHDINALSVIYKEHFLEE